MEREIFNLNLLNPLVYKAGGVSEPFSGTEDAKEGEEKLYCFELDREECTKFESDTAKIPGALLFGGMSYGTLNTAAESTTVQLPAGTYLFAQKRKILSKDETAYLASEIQQEGLWRRLELGNMLYLRYLYEDGSPVTQLYRSLRGSETENNKD